ncbi:MAG: hypothetical protein L6W00_06430 [Lentisphaeria bacterium]|nr:MAG: hypothetical protein L6W00_06430 [Lentisphaeria bacterium]
MKIDHVLRRTQFRFTALFAALFTAAATAFAESAVILYSDGSSRSGELSIMGNRPLILRLPDSKIQQKFQLADLVSITQSVESATMNRPWLYTEAGKVDKTYLDGSYPFINFATEVELVSGKKLKGHLISLAFRLRGEDGSGKIFLTRQIKGKVGETLEEKVYPVTIRFPKAEKVPAKPVTGKLSGYGKLQAATLLDVERNVVCPGSVKADGSFRFPRCCRGNTNSICAPTAFSSTASPERRSNRRSSKRYAGSFRWPTTSSPTVGCWRPTAMRSGRGRSFTSGGRTSTPPKNMCPAAATSGTWISGTFTSTAKRGSSTPARFRCVTNSRAAIPRANF